MTQDDLEGLWRPVLEAAAHEADRRGADAGLGEVPPRPDATYRGTLDDARRPDRDTAIAILQRVSTLHARSTVADARPPGGAPTLGGADADHYPIIDEVGRGGMAVVYRARQQVLGRDIALKAAHVASGEKFVAEALITASLEHPNIVPVYDLTTTGDARPALAMKLVGGSTWERALEPADPADRRDLDFHLEVLLAVSNAIALAHSHGIVHCDIKPENVLLGAFGEVLVVDWGIALDFRDAPGPGAIAPPKTALRTPCGTPAYIAPELATATVADIGPATDVYLLGATLYHVATGRAPRDGLPLMEALTDAASADGPRFQRGDRVPDALRAIIDKAMALAPADRYPTVAAFQAAVVDFRRHKESLAITERAREALAASKKRPPGALTDRDRNRLYADYAEIVAAFRQALVLWPDNHDARHGEGAARLDFAEAALAHGDLSLAEAQATHLLEGESGGAPVSLSQRAVAQGLLGRIGPALRARARAQRMGRVLKWTVALAALVIIAGLAIGTRLVADERDLAAESQRLAESRLAEIQQLSDVKHLADLTAAADALWPAEPAQAPALERWLTDARALAARQAGHRQALAALERRGTSIPGRPGAGATWRFASVAEQWEHDTLADLVAGLERLDQTVAPAVAQRLDAARTLAARSLEAPRAAWDAAIRAVAASPRYGGLVIRPQMGLVPLGADPASGLEEFAHLPSGAAPTRGPDGKLALADDTGVVLVLLPGGAFDMGARPPDEAHPLGSPNVDPEARAHQGPVHRVTLDPFFMAKYEVTQAQWLRVMGANPSAYLPGRVMGGRTVTLRHPVEQVGQVESAATLARLGLVLPTEAQWEYAARGGTTTPFWTGEAPESLVGTLNIADEWCRTHEGPASWRYEPWLDDGYTSHAPVGTYRANPFGLHDVNGNVWEWCRDRYGPYATPPAPGDGLRAGPLDAPFVFRGGGLRSNASHARAADRYSLYGTEHRGFDIGLRAARRLER